MADEHVLGIGVGVGVLGGVGIACGVGTGGLVAPVFPAQEIARTRINHALAILLGALISGSLFVYKVLELIYHRS